MVVFDSSFLIFLFVPNAPCSIDRAKERIDFLISDLHGRGDRIMVPTPALSELLVRTGHSTNLILNELTRSPRFQVIDFDTRAAVEVARMSIDAMNRGPKRGAATDTWAKVKYDRQIVAIARVVSASAIYSEDVDLRSLAESCGLTAKSIVDCQLPYAQHKGKGLFPEPEDDPDRK